MIEIDLNCDVGEGAGADAAILPHVTSANVACGFHAGDPRTMRETVSLAVAHGVAVGAHPGLADRGGFGRGVTGVTPEEAYDLVVYQVGALAAFATAAGTSLSHVKPHGSLYNLAAADGSIAAAVARAVWDVDPALVLFGLSGGRLLQAGREAGLRTASEVFADRGYRADGTLVPRGAPGALVEDAAEVVRRAVRVAGEGRVRSVGGEEIAVRAETLCIHGDAPGAAGLARGIRDALTSRGYSIRAIRRDR